MVRLSGAGKTSAANEQVVLKLAAGGWKLLCFQRQLPSQNVHWRKPALARCAQAQRVVALGQAAAVPIHHQTAVKPGGIVVSQGAIEQDLAGGGLEQVGATHHFRDAHGRVVGHTGKLVAGHSVAPPDDKVSKVAAGHKALRTQVAILKLDRFAVGDAESPVDAVRGSDLVRGRAGKSRSSIPETAAEARPTG